MNDKELFKEVFNNFSSRYHGLKMVGTLVYYNDEIVFNTDGYNLLYNLTRLCSTLEKELL